MRYYQDDLELVREESSHTAQASLKHCCQPGSALLAEQSSSGGHANFFAAMLQQHGGVLQQLLRSTVCRYAAVAVIVQFHLACRCEPCT